MSSHAKWLCSRKIICVDQIALSTIEKVFLKVFYLYWRLSSVLNIMMVAISLRFVFVTVKTLHVWSNRSIKGLSK